MDAITGLIIVVLIQTALILWELIRRKTIIILALVEAALATTTIVLALYTGSLILTIGFVLVALILVLRAATSFGPEIH